MSRIVAIGTAVPQYKYHQSDISDYMIQSHHLADEKEIRKLKIIYNKSAISFRHSVLPDFKLNGRKPVLFGLNGAPTPNVQSRLNIYDNESYNLSAKAIDDCILAAEKNSDKKFDINCITHLITVSCTGMSAPGLEIKIVNNYGMKKNITRFAVNFMGCYAAFHALKIADSICKADEKAVVLIVCVELCTLHFQREFSEDNLLANALFADGASALIVSGKANKNKYYKTLKPVAFETLLLEEGSKDMAWNISSEGFKMTLSSYVPNLVYENINKLLANTINKLTIKNISYYAIHPGGKKIIDQCKKILNLSDDEVDASVTVLNKFGNMSAPTILFVLKELWENKIIWDGPDSIFAAGFGPGLTMEAAVLKAGTT